MQGRRERGKEAWLLKKKRRLHDEKSKSEKQDKTKLIAANSKKAKSKS